MNNSNISRKYKKIYELSQYSNITTDKMKSESITKKYYIPIKSRNISGENQENKEEDIEVEVKVGPYIPRYCKCKYIYTKICEYKWYEYRILWRYTKVWDIQLWFDTLSMREKKRRKIEEEKNK